MRHLDLLNVALALRFRQPGYPTCLADAGYSVQAVGVSFKTAAGDTVAPDVIASHLDRRLTLLIEIKGGAQLELDQLSRMERVTPLDLRDYAHLVVPDPDQHRAHIVYLCNEEHRANLASELGGRPASMIGFDGQRFRLSGAPLPDPDLGGCLESALVAADAVPLAIVPFDRKSPDDEVARAILPELVDAWLAGEGSVRPESLVAKTHTAVHGIMGSTGTGSEMKDVLARVKDVLTVLAKSDLAEWLERASSQPAAWRFLKAPPTDRRRTLELQRLGRSAARYLERVGERQAIQLKLFGDGDEGEEV